MTEAEIENEKTQKILKSLSVAYKKTFESKAGKIVLDDLRKTLSEPRIRIDSHDLYYHMGRRNVMLMIEEKLKER